MWMVCYISAYSTDNILIFLNSINRNNVVTFVFLKCLWFESSLISSLLSHYCIFQGYVLHCERHGSRAPPKAHKPAIGKETFVCTLPYWALSMRFRNGDKCYRDFEGKFPENREIVEFPKSEPFNRKFLISLEKSQMDRKSPAANFRKLPKKNKMAFVGILSQIKLLFRPLVIQLVWYIQCTKTIIHLSVSESGGYLPPLW